MPTLGFVHAGTGYRRAPHAHDLPDVSLLDGLALVGKGDRPVAAGLVDG